MTTTHWLELWTPLAAYYRVHRALLQRRPTEAPRSLLRFFATRSDGDPNWFDLDEHLDCYEAARPALADLGIAGHQAALWLSCQHEDQASELTLDPLTMLRLSELELKLCWECYQAEWGQFNNAATLPGVPVNLRDLGSEPDAEQPQRLRQVWVSLDDDTLWEATFTTHAHMRWQWQQPGATTVQVGTYWQPSVVVVPDFSEASLERAIADLLRQRTFEQAFTCLAGAAQAPAQLTQPQLALEILHHAPITTELAPLAELLGADAQPRAHQWWASRPSSLTELATHTQQWVQLLRDQMCALLAFGIHRNDLALVWSLPYQQRAHLEVGPAVLGELAAQGLTLRLRGLAQPERWVRCLDE